MRLRDNPTVEVSRRLDFSPERAWQLVTDITLPTRCDGELQRVEWLDGADHVAVGARFRGHNSDPQIGEWYTDSEIIELPPGDLARRDGGQPRGPPCSGGLTVPAGFALFDTAIGRCGIAWNAAGVVTATQLPERSDGATRARMAAVGVVESEPPESIRRAIDAVVTLTDGSDLEDDLSWVELDSLDLTDFQLAVYRAARRIPPGSTRTYGEIATEIGLPGSAQAVGRALGANPYPIVVPCHRVVAANGRTGGFSAGGGVETKMRLLAIEQAVLGLW